MDLALSSAVGSFLFRLGTIFGRAECWYSLFGQNFGGLLTLPVSKEGIHERDCTHQDNNEEKPSCEVYGFFLLPKIYNRTVKNREKQSTFFIKENIAFETV